MSSSGRRSPWVLLVRRHLKTVVMENSTEVPQEASARSTQGPVTPLLWEPEGAEISLGEDVCPPRSPQCVHDREGTDGPRPPPSNEHVDLRCKHTVGNLQPQKSGNLSRQHGDPGGHHADRGKPGTERPSCRFCYVESGSVRSQEKVGQEMKEGAM